MLFEDSRWRKFSQLVAHHVFRHKDGVKNLAVVNEERVPHELRRNGRTTRPGLDRLFRTRFIELVDFLEEVLVDERTFFK